MALKPVQSFPFEALTSLQRSVAWSDSDQIAVLTNLGIRIYHPVYRPYLGAGEKQLKINESFVKPPEKIPTDFSTAPTLHCDFDAIFWNYDDPAIVACLTLDRVVAGPELDPGDFASYNFSEAKWSPIVNEETSDCFLATLTFDNRSFIYLRGPDGEYVRVSSELSELLAAHYAETAWPDLAQVEETLANLYDSTRLTPFRRKEPEREDGVLHKLAKAYSTALTSVCWKKSLVVDKDAKTHAVLFTATRSGYVVVWRVFSDVTPPQVAAMFLTDFGVESMSVLETSENESLVFVGTKCGTVEVFSLSFTGGDGEGSYVAEAATLIDWDHPFIQFNVNYFVSNISATVEQGTVHIYFSKNHVLVCLTAELDPENSKVLRLSKGGKVDVGCVPINALAPSGDGGIVVCSESGRCAHVRVKPPADELDESLMEEVLESIHTGSESDSDVARLKLEIVRTLDLGDDWKKFSATGAGVSPSSAIYCVAQRVNVPYDHLRFRQTSRVNFFCVGSCEKSSAEERKQALLTSLKEVRSSLKNKGDLLESARMIGVTVQDLLDFGFDVENDLVHAKIHRWVALTHNKDDSAENLRRRLDAAVFRLAGMQLLEEFLSQEAPFTDAEVAVDASSKIPRMLRWLRKLTPSDHPRLSSTERRIMEVFDLKSSARVPDKCPVCDAVFSEFGGSDGVDVDPCETKCENGHRFPRSCLTMEPCVEMPMRRCERCLAFAGPISAWMSRSTCLLCDGLLIPTC